MTSVVNEKRIRNLSTISFDSDNVDQGNPKTQDNERKRQDSGRNMTGDTEIGLQSNTCIVCDRNDNWVLICHKEKCPLAIHQSCMTDEPDFDEFGNFYCPYCWYKRLDLKRAKLRKKLMVTDSSRKGRETLVGVALGLMMDKETEDIKNVVEVNVSESTTLARVNRNGKRNEGDGSYNEFMAMEKDQRMREVAVQTQSSDNSEAHDADLSEGRLSETNHETSDACTSNAPEGIRLKEKCCEKIHAEVQVRNSDEGEKRKRQKGSDYINHEPAPAHSIDAGVKKGKQRRYNEKSWQKNRVAGAHGQDVVLNDEATQSHDFDLGVGRSGQGCYHENNQQKKVLSTESCEQEVSTTDKRVLHGSGVGEGRYRERRHTEAVEIENLKELSNDRKRKREGVKRDGDEFYCAENQDRQDQVDMRNDGVAFNEQVNDFRKDEQGDRNSISFVSSPVSGDNVNEVAASQELALIVHPKAGVQERPKDARPVCYVSSKKQSFQPENYGHKSYLEKNGTVSNDPGQSKFVSCSDRKRKRRFWTQAEEEMLKVGVQKFPGGRNIPWRKILEFGRNVFHDERVPSDLKDKWKTLNKTSFDTGKWENSLRMGVNYIIAVVSLFEEYVNDLLYLRQGTLLPSQALL